MIGSARIDETGKVIGGLPGDQNGREVATQSYYLHSKGWYCLRAKDDNVALRIADQMKQACANNNIGYSQRRRNTLRQHVLYYDIMNLSEVNKKVECDCSELVRTCVMLATGYLQTFECEKGRSINFTTANEKELLLNTGLFNLIDFKKADDLCTGDILVTKTKGHTVIVTEGKTPGNVLKATVSAYSLTVRDGASANCRAVRWLKKGDDVTIIRENNGWGEIAPGEWINLKYTNY